MRADRFADFSLWFAGARACRRLFGAALATSACVGLEAGALRAEGSGLEQAVRMSDLWLAPSAGLDLGVPVWRRLAAFVRAEVAVPLVRRPYVVNEVEGVHRPGVLVPRFAAGLGWAFE